MFKNLEVIYRDLKELTEKRLSILLFLILLGVNQLIYTHVPLALLLNLLLLGAALHLYNLRFHKDYRKHLLLVCLYLVFVYVFSLFSLSEFILYSLLSLTLLWVATNFAIYLMGEEPFLEKFLAGLLQLLRAGLYFGVLYGIIYLISYLINQVFFLKLPYNGMIFRIANSLSSMAGLLVLFAGKKEAKVGNFFTLLFGKIVPKLSLVFGLLALVYSIQALLGFVDVYPPFIFYALSFLFYLAFILYHKTEMKEWERKSLLALFFGLTLVYLLIRLNLFGKTAEIYKGRSYVHELLILFSFLLLQLYFLVKKEKSLKELKVFVGAVLLILFLPAVGMMVHEKYSLSEVTRKSQLTALEQFKQDKIRKDQPPEMREADVVKYIYPNSTVKPLEISVEGYNYLVELNWSRGDTESYSYKESSLRMDQDMKRLHLEVGEKKEVFNLFEEAKKRRGDEPLIFETETVRIQIINYFQSEDYYHLDFRALFK